MVCRWTVPLNHACMLTITRFHSRHYLPTTELRTFDDNKQVFSFNLVASNIYSQYILKIFSYCNQQANILFTLKHLKWKSVLCASLQPLQYTEQQAACNTCSWLVWALSCGCGVGAAAGKLSAVCLVWCTLGAGVAGAETVCQIHMKHKRSHLLD